MNERTNTCDARHLTSTVARADGETVCEFCNAPWAPPLALAWPDEAAESVETHAKGAER